MKYMGSKARFAKEMLPIILKNRQAGQYYVEPFAGGMNMICEVSGNRIANDINLYLISMWESIIHDNYIPDKIDKRLYGLIRDNKEQYPNHVVGWAAFNCSYSGKYFGGFAGETKTKTGTIRDYQAEAIKNIIKQRKKMMGVQFMNKNYYDLVIPPNSIVYCDPPYQGTTKYANEFDHAFFWNWVREINKLGHMVYISEYNAPNDFKCIWSKQAKSSLSANGIIGGNKTSVEKLFTWVK